MFVDCLGTNSREDALTEELGEHWSVANGYHKVFACCGYAHSAVEATLDCQAGSASAPSTIRGRD